jgi:tetratricopeptide (TPR) repeat protein
MTSDEKTPGPDGEASKLDVAQLTEMARGGIASARARDFENGYLLLGEVCDRLRAAGEKLPAHVISYYGLCLGLHLGKHREASALCQAAIDVYPMKADYYDNLAEVCAAARQRRKAVTAVQRGLAIDPDNARLLDLEARLGRRRDPVVSSLRREHPVNVTLGRIRHALAGPPRMPKREGRPKKSE